jgi:hypothetical protein
MLLQEEDVFEDISSKKAQELIMKGVRPSFYPEVWNSTDPSDVAMKEAMIMCHQHDPRTRATARKVSDYLVEKLEQLDPGRVAQWENSR